MAISIAARIPRLPQNLVLYMDITIGDESNSIDRYVATLHEATKEQIKAFPSLPCNSRSEILYCYGTRLEELQATLAFVDILLGYRHSQGNRAQMESWLLSCTPGKGGAYTICNKVRHEGILQDICKPEARLANFFAGPTPRVVPETAF